MNARFRLKSTIPGYTLLAAVLLQMTVSVLDGFLTAVPAWESVAVRALLYSLLAFVGALAWWVYSFHVDLEHVVPGYPLGAAAGLAQALIPIYNLWGLWNIFHTADRHLPGARPLSVRQAALYLYTVWILGTVIGWYAQGTLSLIISLLEASTWLVLCGAVATGLRSAREARVADAGGKRDLFSVLKS